MIDHAPICIVLIGLPASGKSTFRAEIMASFAAVGRFPVVISSDDYIDDLATSLGCSYSEAFRQADMKAIDKDIKVRIGDAIARHDDLIIDRTNMTMKTRNRVLSRLSKRYKRVGVDFRVPREILDERLAARAAATGKFIHPEVVDRMFGDYQEPSLSEFDEIIVR